MRSAKPRQDDDEALVGHVARLVEHADVAQMADCCALAVLSSTCPCAGPYPVQDKPQAGPGDHAYQACNPRVLHTCLWIRLRFVVHLPPSLATLLMQPVVLTLGGARHNEQTQTNVLTQPRLISSHRDHQHGFRIEAQ